MNYTTCSSHRSYLDQLKKTKPYTAHIIETPHPADPRYHEPEAKEAKIK